MSIRELLSENNPDLLFADGFDDCILGICDQFGKESVVAYDLQKIIRKLEKDGMSEEDALDYYSFNIVGAYMGEFTPVFVNTEGVK